MPSPILVAGVPATIVPGNADASTDLPASQWPSLDRVAVVDLVGPTAANRQVRSLQKRTRVVADSLNRAISSLNFITGVTALFGDYSRKAHAVGDVALTAGPIAVQDDLEYFLARDGSSVMWGRLNIGHARTLMYASSFESDYHWVQGPDSADVTAGDVDMAWGLKRLAANDYEIYIWKAATAYRVLTTYDFPGGTGSFLAAVTNNDRVVGLAGGGRLIVESTNVTATTPASIGVAITTDDTYTLRVVKGEVGLASIVRAGATGYAGEMLRFDGSSTSLPFNRSKPLSIALDFTNHGIAIGHIPHGAVAGWGVSDYSHEAIQLPYAGTLRVAFGAIESVRMCNGQVPLGTSPTTVAADSHLSIVMDATGEPASGTKQPKIGFERRGVNSCALYYNGIEGGRHSIRVRGMDGVDDRLAYISESGGGGGGGSGVPVGAIVDFGMSAVPSGYLPCDGTVVSQATYADLFAKIGTTWNTGGEGAGNFRLPDFRRKTAVGSGGTTSAVLGNAVGNTGGDEGHALTLSEMPSHAHVERVVLPNGTGGADVIVNMQTGQSYGSSHLIHGTTMTGHYWNGIPLTDLTTGSAGGSDPLSNIQPSAVTNKCIRWQITADPVGYYTSGQEYVRTATGAANLTVPAGVTRMYFEVVGGGGGGSLDADPFYYDGAAGGASSVTGSVSGAIASATGGAGGDANSTLPRTGGIGSGCAVNLRGGYGGVQAGGDAAAGYGYGGRWANYPPYTAVPTTGYGAGGAPYAGTFGTGGAGGGCAMGWKDVVPGEVLTLTVGAGGGGGSSAPDGVAGFIVCRW